MEVTDAPGSGGDPEGEGGTPPETSKAENTTEQRENRDDPDSAKNNNSDVATGQAGNAETDNVKTDSVQADNVNNEIIEPEWKEASAIPEEAVEVMAEIGTAGFRLSGRKAEVLNHINNGDTGGIPEEPSLQPKNVDQVKLEDSFEENENKQRKILLWTGVAAACMCAAGAAAEVLTFRRRLQNS